MGKRGPKPKPTFLNLLDGNPSNRPMNPQEPVCDCWPVKPSLVASDTLASSEWDRLAAVVPPKLYTAMDETVLMQYALAWSQLVKAQTEINDRGLLIETPICNRNGDVIAYKVEGNPALPAWAKANETLFKTGDRLGLSPGTRSRLNVPNQTEARSRFAGLLGKQENGKTSQKA